ncbi:hypothetical protein L1987_70242 [Smallanthus sonchifolius]|uniref:Uncharacterized protein n=1 Tax=Smallanthus sonchifolius TaxID=185202 RepID=A0ACB9AQC3_9ASTR|nr:hypothetical protein L1987_70242 [Smallanthus sonchifolius]
MGQHLRNPTTPGPPLDRLLLHLPPLLHLIAWCPAFIMLFEYVEIIIRVSTFKVKMATQFSYSFQTDKMKDQLGYLKKS